MANSPNLVCVGIHRDTHAKLVSMKRDEIDTFDIVINRLILAQKKKKSSDVSASDRNNSAPAQGGNRIDTGGISNGKN